MSSNGWSTRMLEECSEIIFSGGTPATKNPNYWGGSIKWLSSGETRNDFIYDTVRKITLEGVRNSSTKLAKFNDVVIASAGQGNTRGQTSLCKVETYINQSIIAIRANQKILNPVFLYYNIKNRYSELRKISDGSSIRGSLTTKDFKKLLISVPDINEQNLIGNILASLDEKIEVNNRMNKALENMAQEIFKSWFIDFEFPNEDGEPYKSSDGEMIESEQGLIPKGWSLVKLEYFVNVRYGKDHKKLEDGYIPVFGSGGIMRYVNKSLYSSESVLIPRKGTLNNVMYLNESFWSVDTMFFTEMKRAKTAKFIYFFMKDKDLMSMNSGSAVPSMTTDILNNLKIVRPPLAIIETYDEIIQASFEIIKNNKTETEKLTAIRDILLSKLMSGEIRVPMEES